MKEIDIKSEIEEKFNIKISQSNESNFRQIEIKLLKIKKFLRSTESANNNVKTIANRIENAIKIDPKLAENLISKGWKKDVPVIDFMMNNIRKTAEESIAKLDSISNMLINILDDSYKGGICNMIMYGENKSYSNYSSGRNPLLDLLLTKDFYENASSSKKVAEYFSEFKKKLLEIKNDK